MTRPTLCDEQSFEHWRIRILNLPFDLAQGGELVEPFRASCLETGDPPEGWGVRRTNFEFDLFEGGDSLVRFHSPDPGFLLHLVRVRRS